MSDLDTICRLEAEADDIKELLNKMYDAADKGKFWAYNDNDDWVDAYDELEKLVRGKT